MNTWTSIPLVSCLTYIALYAVALQSIEKNTYRRANKVFVYYLTVAAVWSFTSFMLHLNAYPKMALFWNQILTVALVGTLITYYHFVQAYVNRKDRRWLYTGYGLLIVLAIFTFTGHIVQYSYVIKGVLYHSLGISIYFIGAFSLVYVVAVIGPLVKRYRTSTDPVDRNRTMYLMVGWSILVVLTYTNLIPPLDMLPLDHIGNLFNAIIIFYAISQFQLLDIKFVVRKGLTYFILISVLVAAYISAIYFGYNLISTQPPIGIVSLATVIALLLTLTASPLEHFIREGIDRMFYRETYDYRQAIFSFRNKMGNILDMGELANEILPAITKALHVTYTRLLFQDESGDFAAQFTFPKKQDDRNGELKFNVDNPIINYLDRHGIPLSMEQISAVPELKGLWQSEKMLIARVGLGLLCPITSHGKLIGILALGNKERATPYSRDDIELVRSMASQAGVIIENAQLYQRANLLASTDWLTGLYNHRNFHERMEQEIARSSRFGAVFSLIMMDLDLFKSYNDTCGHLAGDEALKNIGKTIQDSIRSIDMAFRYGGEEFTVILPETRLEDAHKVAERIRRAVETRTSTSCLITLTASFGVASWPIDGVMKEEMIARADAALYRAKELGRNRTSLSSEMTKPEKPLVGLELESRSKALNTIYALAATVDAKDHYTYGHSKKVSDYSVAIAEVVGLPQKKIATIRTAGLLHDIGKVGIPDSILKKKEPLTEAEWALIKDHPRQGVEILRHVDDLLTCLPAVLHHHERYDGSGYPSGLKGEGIPLEARILAIADAYEAITSERYRYGQPSRKQAIAELRRCAGTQFDPGLLDVFCKILEPAPADAPKTLEAKP